MVSNELSEAARLAQSADPGAARPLVERLLAERPCDPNVLTVAGLVAERIGDNAGALAAFAKALAGDPDNPARLGNHAIALKRAGRFDEAVAALMRSLAIRPGSPTTLSNLGSCLIAAERPAEAEAPLREAIRAKPDHFEAWNNLGVALARTGRSAEACEAYDRALALRPDYAEAALNRADALTAIGRSTDAEAVCRAVLNAQPANARAANMLAGLRDATGATEEAIRIYRNALERGGLNHPVGINLTMALLRAGQPTEALDLADRMIADLPSVTTPLALKSAALERLGRSDELAALMGIDRFVRVVEIEEVPAFGSVAVFNDALEAELRAHPSLTYEPEGLVTRKGRQSSDLAAAPTPALAALGAIATQAATTYIDDLKGSDHAFLRARPPRWSLTLWGTILSPGGAVEPHIHAPNWLSGVYYPALPDEVEQGADGAFAIGLLPETLGGGGTPYAFTPRAGRLILFPSFLWHCTLPFAGKEDRTSFAFDCVPDKIGRPHRLRQ